MLAPSDFKYSECSSLPDDAQILYPSFDNKDIATLPTPPVAPVTNIYPLSGVIPLFSRAITHSIEVYPAVPIAIACLGVNSFGI